MADFKTHITVSSGLGVLYGAVAFQHFGLPAPTCVLAGALCGVSGMLPDLDSDSGVPLRESLSFASACVPMLLLDRFQSQFHWTPETMVLVGAGIYALVRFGLGTALKKYTVHRGMFHSIPAAAIAGEVAFLLCATGDIYVRAYKACAVVIGFLSHLILDEIWSVQLRGPGGMRLKSSSGTAMKLWGESGWANISCYGKLILLGVVMLNDPIWSTVSPGVNDLHTADSTILRSIEGYVHLPAWATALTTSSSSGYAPAPQYAQPQYQQPQQAYAPYSTNQPYNGQPAYATSQPYATQPQYAAQPQYAPQYSNTPQYGAPTNLGAAPSYSSPGLFTPSPQTVPPMQYAPPGQYSSTNGYAPTTPGYAPSSPYGTSPYPAPPANNMTPIGNAWQSQQPQNFVPYRR
jgi:hypothetical protein